MNINQLGRELTRRLVETTGCDLQTAVRFFYNSELYMELEQQHIDDCSIDKLFVKFEKEYLGNFS